MSEMNDEETTSFDAFSLSPVAAEDEAARLAAASYPASSSPTDDDEDDDEDGEGPEIGSPEEVAGPLPPRLAARMGSEHSAWSFAGAGAAQEAASMAAEFCRQFCPIEHRCAGADCRVYRFEEAAHASLAYDEAQEPVEEFDDDA